MPLGGSLSLPTVSRGTLFELSCRAEQLGRAAQPAFTELSKGRTIVGGRAVPNFLMREREINGGRYVGLESDEKSFENSVRANGCRRRGSGAVADRASW